MPFQTATASSSDSPESSDQPRRIWNSCPKCSCSANILISRISAIPVRKLVEHPSKKRTWRCGSMRIDAAHRTLRVRTGDLEVQWPSEKSLAMYGPRATTIGVLYIYNILLYMVTFQLMAVITMVIPISELHDQVLAAFHQYNKRSRCYSQGL